VILTDGDAHVRVPPHPSNDLTMTSR
jgi:hypothetical protein